MRTLPLLEYVQATADDSGTAQAEISPAKYGDSWVIRLLATNTNSVAESQLRVYRGVVSDSTMVASTYSGNADNAGGSELRLSAGEKLIFVWTNADVGSVCTCRLEGDHISQRW